eukprot:Clim_evm2s243 gene=Clim_evmTU2s243
MGWFAIILTALCCPLVRAGTVVPGLITASPETMEPPEVDDIEFWHARYQLRGGSKEILSRGEAWINLDYNPPRLEGYEPYAYTITSCESYPTRSAHTIPSMYHDKLDKIWCGNPQQKELNELPRKLYTKIVGSDVSDHMLGAYAAGVNKDSVNSGYNHNEIFVMGKGDDIVIGACGNDSIFGGPGSDVLHGDEGDDLIVGNEAGDDSPDMDIIFSGPGSDTVYAQGGDDWIYTDEIGENDLDWLSGGTGHDTFVISVPKFKDGGIQEWTLEAGDLFLGFGNDIIDLIFTAYFPAKKIGKEIAPMSLDIVKWLIDGAPGNTKDPPHKGRCVIADFNPLQDRILVQLDPYRLSPNISVQPANNGENAWVLTQDGFDLCYVNWAPADEMFGEQASYIGDEANDILIKTLQRNLRIIGGGKFALGVEVDPQWYEDVVDEEMPGALDETEGTRYLMIGNWGGHLHVGSSGRDHVIGSDNENGDILYGYAVDVRGGDVIAVKDGDDILRGFGGPDVLAGGSGFNQIYGGEGEDSVSYAHTWTSIIVDMERTGEWHGDEFFVAWNGFNFVNSYDPDEDIFQTGRDGHDWVFGVENVIGGLYDDEIYGNGESNVIAGGAGYNTLRGGGKNDTFVMTDAGTNEILDFDATEGDFLVIDRETYTMNLMDTDYHVHDLVYYHQDGSLYIEIKSSRKTVAIMPGVTMNQGVWNQMRVENDRQKSRNCIEDRDGTTGFCLFNGTSNLMECKGNWMCNGSYTCHSSLGKCSYDPPCLPMNSSCGGSKKCCSGMNCVYEEFGGYYHCSYQPM